MHGQTLTLAATDQAAVEREVRAQTVDLLVTLAQGFLHIGDAGARDLLGALEHGDTRLQRVGLLVRTCALRRVPAVRCMRDDGGDNRGDDQQRSQPGDPEQQPRATLLRRIVRPDHQ